MAQFDDIDIFAGPERDMMGVPITGSSRDRQLDALEGMVRAIVILQSSMPVAVSNYLFAVIYKREPEEVASMVLISAALSVITLPLLLLYLL